MRSLPFLLMLVVYLPLPLPGQRLLPPRKYHSDDEDEQHLEDDEDDVDANATGIFFSSLDFSFFISSY